MENTSLRTFITGIIFSVFLCTIAMLVFLICRNRYRFVFFKLSLSFSRASAPPPDESIFKLIFRVFSFPNSQTLYEERGFGTFVFIFFLFKICCFSLLFIAVNGVVLSMINTFSDNANITEESLSSSAEEIIPITGLDIFTIAHISDKSNILWLHFISVWVNSFFVMFVLRQAYVEFNKTKRLYRSLNTIHQRTVMIDNCDYSVSESSLKNKFLSFFPDVVEVHKAFVSTTLEATKRKYEENIIQLEQAQRNLFVSKLKAAGQHTGNCLDNVFVSIENEIHENYNQVSVLSNQVRSSEEIYQIVFSRVNSMKQSDKSVPDRTGQENQSKQKKKKTPLLSNQKSLSDRMLYTESRTAFITFSTLSSAAACVRSETIERPELRSDWAISPAPAPDDVLWDQLGVVGRKRKIKKLIAHVLVVFIIISWTTPTALARMLSSPQSLAMYFEWDRLYDFTVNFPRATTLLSSILPVILQPLLFRIGRSLISKSFDNSGFHRKTRCDQAKMLATFFLASANFVIIASFAGSFFDGLYLLNSSWIAIVFERLPQQSTYFIIFIILFIIIKFFQISHLLPIVKSNKVLKNPKATKRTIRAMKAPNKITIWEELPFSLLILSISFYFSTIAPLVSAFGFIYFVVEYFRVRFLFLYTSFQSNEDNGDLFPSLFFTVVFSLFIYQFVSLIVLHSKGLPFSFTLFLLMMITICFGVYVRLYLYPLSYLPPLEDNIPYFRANDLEIKVLLGEEKKKKTLNFAELCPQSFVPPSFQPSEVVFEDQSNDDARQAALLLNESTRVFSSVSSKSDESQSTHISFLSESDADSHNQHEKNEIQDW